MTDTERLCIIVADFMYKEVANTGDKIKPCDLPQILEYFGFAYVSTASEYAPRWIEKIGHSFPIYYRFSKTYTVTPFAATAIYAITSGELKSSKIDNYVKTMKDRQFTRICEHQETPGGTELYIGSEGNVSYEFELVLQELKNKYG
eukprot:302731_1